MSSGEQANQQPPALENFLIVAYRSLRGNKRVSAFGCPKDLLDASADKIELMKKHATFVKEPLDNSLFTHALVKFDESPEAQTVSFLLFRNNKPRRCSRPDQFEIYSGGTHFSMDNTIYAPVQKSFCYQQGGFSGLTVIIHDCYVVILAQSAPRVIRYYKDEEGQIKCETTAIPVKPQASYYNGWASCNRSFVHHANQIAFVTEQGQIAFLDLMSPAAVVLKSPEPSTDPNEPPKYVDVKLHDQSTFGLFAVTACGRIDYYQGAKRLVHSHTIDRAELQVGSKQQPFPVFTTIGCDHDFLALGYMLQRKLFI